MSANRRTAAPWALGVLVLTALIFSASSAMGQDPVPVQVPAQAPAAADTDMPRFQKLSEGVAIGAKPTTAGFRKISEMGFKTIMNLTALKEGSMIEAKTVEFYGLKYINLECDPENFTGELLEEFAKAVQNKEDQPIFVHCRNGNRAAALWMIYRVKKEGWKQDAALEEAVKLGLDDAAIKAVAVKFLRAKA